jgi:4-hydroxythreonine-4-phosphate dehydrogenase
MSKKILLFSGDPNSVNSEIIFKSFKNLSSTIKKKIYIIANYQLLKDQFKKLNFSQKIVKVKSIDDLKKSDKIKILDIKIKYKNVFEISKKNNSYFLGQALNLSHKLSLNKKVAGFINCPINKNLLKKKNIGLTEIFAKKCKVKKNSEVMLIRNNKIAVSPMTTHVNLKDVSKKINQQLILRKITTLNKWFKKYEKKKPRLCLLGLNPHNSEFSKNSEEKKILLPVVKKLKKNGFKISGPLPADTIFINDYKNFDVIIGMYHDQVITPFKSIFKFDGINITLGLKYLRVSPDHGIASDLIGKNKANPKSLIECIKFINKFT